jgi:predicted dehydrogenase
MSGETVRIGVIGAGDISHYHLGGLQAAGGADVRVISGRTAERIAPVAQQYGIPDIETDYRAVLARDDIDAVMILTPENSHEEIAVAAAEAGKAMMVQKPVADTIGSCERLIEAAERAGVNLQVSYMHRYFEEVVYARDLIRSGQFGEIHTVRMRNATPGAIMPWYYDPAVVKGGVVFSLGSHGIDLIQHLVGAIEDVSARTATMLRERTFSNDEVVTDIELEDIAFATYRMKNGIVVEHEMSGCEKKGTDRFLVEIYSENGTMLLRGPRGPLAIYAPDITGTSDWHLPDLADQPFGARHHAHWLDIVRGVLPDEASGWDSLAGMHVIQAVYQAAECGGRAIVPFLEKADYDQ